MKKLNQIDISPVPFLLNRIRTPPSFIHIHPRSIDTKTIGSIFQTPFLGKFHTLVSLKVHHLQETLNNFGQVLFFVYPLIKKTSSHQDITLQPARNVWFPKKQVPARLKCFVHISTLHSSHNALGSKHGPERHPKAKKMVPRSSQPQRGYVV